MKRVLVGSPVHQSSNILKEFLLSLDELNKDGLEVDYCFVDDNTDEESSRVLKEFKEKNGNVTILEADYYVSHGYICDDYTHRWTEDLVAKVTRFKNSIIEIAKEQEYDYLFFIDSDIVLHPKTLHQLISDEKEIVSNVFWTQWNPDTEPLPQVWLKDAYTLYDAKANVNITQNEIGQYTRDFIEMLKKPGLFKVGGLGACTLISRSALLKGVNFDPVYNISFWGEDRHFCIRAAVLDIQLYVDTYYPAYHIYRTTDLPGVSEYKEKAPKRDTEILGSQILDIIIEGIEKSNTYSYKDEVSKDFINYFTTYEAAKKLDSIKKDRNRVIKNKLVNKCKVHECTMTFYENNTKVIAKVKVAMEGYKNFYSFYEEYDTVCTVAQQPNGKFLIEQFNIDTRRPVAQPPIVRKVSEKPKLTLSMIVKDEEHRYLKEVLTKCREFIDNAVIIDDGSSDNTVAMCREILDGIPLKLVENNKSQFNNETNLRKQQWFETIATNPEWILFLDADEVFEDNFKNEVSDMMKDFDTDGYIFRLFDFWNDTHYRDDKLWYAHLTYRPFMIRYQKNYQYTFTETAQHCGRMPDNVLYLPYTKSELRLKHYGWATEEDRVSKYNRYMELDPDGRYGSMEQYISILDPAPKLARWNEYERN